MRANEATILEETLKLKISMMKKFMLLMIMYYFYEVVIYGFMPMVSSDFMYNSFATILH